MNVWPKKSQLIVAVMSQPSNPYAQVPGHPAVAPGQPTLGKDVPDLNPFPLDTMMRVDVRQSLECLGFFQ